jgi:hypothetical protein
MYYGGQYRSFSLLGFAMRLLTPLDRALHWVCCPSNPLVVAGTAMLVLGSNVVAQATIPQATAPARIEQKQKQTRQILPENYDLKRYPVTQANVKHWRNILWTTAIVAPKADYVATALDSILALANRSNLSSGQEQTLLAAFQVGTQLYLTQDPIYASLRSRFVNILTLSQDADWISMSLTALRRGGAASTELETWIAQIQRRFPRWNDNPMLYSTITDVQWSMGTRPFPPLQDLLSWTIAPRQPHLFVICQPDRRVLCTTILRDSNGQFLREPVAAASGAENQLWSVPLLLESIHNIGWNFNRGRTPQGIYRIEGTVAQPDYEFFRAYGQFELVNLFAPRESGVRSFIPGRPGTIADLSAYQSLLPPSWRQHFPIQQSYWAGKLGRGLFRIHGSGEDLQFFNNKPALTQSTDWNPTLGCLSALETYDESGRLMQADMPKILRALRQVGGPRFSGYLVVVEVPSNTLEPMSLVALETMLQPTSNAAMVNDRTPSAVPNPGMPTHLVPIESSPTP